MEEKDYILPEESFMALIDEIEPSYYGSELYIRAIQIIVRAGYLHDVDVNQKYDDKPYSFHLCSVLNTAMRHMFDTHANGGELLAIIFAAAFHDSIEDARLTYNDVYKIASEYMDHCYAKLAADIVYALTNEKGKTRAERADERYYAGIRDTQFASFVKLCDRYSNMEYSISTKSSMAKKYIEEYPSFIEHIRKYTSDNELNIPNSLLERTESLVAKFDD